MVYRKNDDRMGAGFISVYLKNTLAGSFRWFLCPRMTLYVSPYVCTYASATVCKHWLIRQHIRMHLLISMRICT